MFTSSVILGIVETVLATGIGGFFGWFFTRKKQNIDTIDAAIDTWQKVVDSLERQVQKQIVTIDSLREERDNFSTHVKELLDLREKDSKEIEQLRIKVDELSLQLKKREADEDLIIQLKNQLLEKEQELEALKKAK